MTTYIRPIVMVFQEFANLSTATGSTSLNPCIIGPCYHVIDVDTSPLLAYAGMLTNAGVTDLAIPSNLAGAEIDEDSVSVTLEEVVVQLNSVEYVGTGIYDNMVQFSSGVTYPDEAAVGDIIDIVDSNDSDAVLVSAARIISVDTDNYRLYLNKVYTDITTTLGVTLSRSVADVTVSTGLTVDTDDEEITLTAQTVTIETVARTITSAKIYISYKALRTDLTGITTVYNTAEALAAFGSPTTDNPLAYGVMIALANTNTGVKAIGVASDNVTGYTTAKDSLETAEDIYSLVPLSQTTAIINIFKNHAVAMSVPAEGTWRVCIGSTPLATTKELQTGDAQIRLDNSSDKKVIYDASAEFLTNGVIAGDTFTITDDEATPAAFTFIIDEVVSEDMLVLSTELGATFDEYASSGSGAGTSDTEYAYVITTSLDRTEQATEIAAVSTAFGSSRMIHVWPDVCEIDDVEEPGYYLACAVAGMTASLPSHQGFTRISCAGIGELKHSNTYFNRTQLDIIAGGGTFIFMQETPTAAPYVRHQLTTDMSATEFSEFSFVKNFDYVCILCKETLDRFLGQYNINNNTLGILETAVAATLESLRIYSLPKIGSPVLDYSITSVLQSETSSDRVEIYCDVWFPYALNTVGLHLISQ